MEFLPQQRGDWLQMLDDFRRAGLRVGSDDFALHDWLPDSGELVLCDLRSESGELVPRDLLLESGELVPRDLLLESGELVPRDLLLESGELVPRDSLLESGELVPRDSLLESDEMVPRDLLPATADFVRLDWFEFLWLPGLPDVLSHSSRWKAWLKQEQGFLWKEEEAVYNPSRKRSEIRPDLWEHCHFQARICKVPAGHFDYPESLADSEPKGIDLRQ